MPYTPSHDPWVDLPDHTTPINAASLNYIEDGIVTAQADIDGLMTRVFNVADYASMAAAYAAAAVDGGIMWFDGGTYSYSTDQNWTSNKVSVQGAGSGAVTLVPTGTAKIVARPSVFTITQGPRFKGFTVLGNATTGATGIYTGDIIGASFDDVVVKDFTGTGAVGVDIYNNTNWTERNYFGIRVDNCKTGVLVHGSGAGVYSFEYNHWDLQLLVNAGQVGVRSTGNMFVRGGKLDLVANVVDAGTVMSIEGTSTWHLTTALWGEQTTGTGGFGIVQASGAIAYLNGDVDVLGLTNTDANTPSTFPTQILGGSFYTNPTTGAPSSKVVRHLIAAHTRAPTVAMLSAAGTSPPAAVVNASSNAVRGSFTCGTGTATTSSQQFAQVSFAEAYAAIPTVVLTPAGYPGAAAGLQPFVFNESTSGFWVGCVVTPATSQANTIYKFNYMVIG